MSELLLAMSDGTSIYENDLIRYYSNDMSKIQYGLARGYDEYENRIIVSALVETRVSPANVIEIYPPEQWQHITFDRDTGYVDMNIYPFDGPFTLTEKKGRSNRIIVDLPYKKYGTFSFLRLMELGTNEFRKQIIMTLQSIINNEVMEFSLTHTMGSSSSLNINIIKNIPYKGLLQFSSRKLLQYSDPSIVHQQIMVDLNAIIVAKILNNNSDVTMSWTTQTEFPSVKISLPYKTTYQINFWDYVNNPTRSMREVEIHVRQVINTDILDGLLNLTEKTMIALPYIESDTYETFSSLFRTGKEYFNNEILVRIRRLINSKLIRHYLYSNGTTIVMDLPWLGDWQIDMNTLWKLGKKGTEDYVIEYLKSLIDKRANTFQYGIVINKEKLNMVMFIYGAPLMEIEEYALKEEIIKHYEDILAQLNMHYWQLKTAKDIKGTGKRLNVSLPIIDHMEYLESESCSTRDVYRLFIRQNDDLYRAYLLVNNRREDRNVIVAAPHIYSENAITVKEAEDRFDNPMKYSKEYLEYLINNKRKDVLTLVEADNSYHNEGVLYL